ncbi:MAG: response regulator transcription factor [Anaerolineae bacterium]|nr:response regulator transcription factor [Anaerolineae bacterium]
MRILVIDDEPEVTTMVRRGLVYAGYSVDTALDAEAGLTTARDTPPDLVVLDRMLPDLDGLEVCRRLRAASPDLPIIMLTAKDAIPDRVAGLEAGADDYLVKPFAFDELLARVKVQLRRTRTQPQTILQFADVSLDTSTREARRGKRLIHLTPKEYELLELFMTHPRQVLTRETIFDRVWGYDFGGESNVIEVYVRYLRKKLGDPNLIQTVREVGYILREELG